MDQCPCGSSLTYDECCRPLIKGERQAATPEHLMRSRYSAYATREIDYLLSSLHPDSRSDFDARATRVWAEGAEWQKLEILETSGGGPDDNEGSVEFIATYVEGGSKKTHHELSTFRKEGGRWYFSGGEPVPPKQVVRQSPKTGRNDPCPCGSGKKFKKCCGQ